MRFKRRLVVIFATSVTVATMAVAVPGTALADNSAVTANEVAAALDNVDARSGLVLDAASSSAVSLLDDPKLGVQVTLPNGQKMSIGLPSAKQGGKGIATRKGAIAYAGSSGSANAAVPAADSVQLLTVIESHKATTTYAYPITLPQGVKVEVTQRNGGGALVYDAAGKLMAIAPPPWARDANDQDVPTWFTTDGKTLTQHIAHKARGVQYPVVADPRFGWNWGPTVWFSRGETQFVITAAGTVWLSAIAGALTGGWVGPAIVATLVEAAKSALRNNQCLAITWVVPWFYQC